ncbi:hypothetical protein [Halobacterium wangiae]|uniref:hypothetical protein n=1 Tax=Halobacterium wangiae TaxID=2902623 RepID=UPI001E4E691D|nr:hypothetical protein [Halobacterium wangiae]
MSARTFRPLADFGTRSLVTHAIMAATFLGAVGSAFLVEGQLRTVTFVALVSFTAGVWVCQSVHSLGNSFTDDDYQGVLRTVLDHGD